jgi:hypothetical protein
MEASMHGTIDRSGRTEKTGYGNWSIRLVVIPVLLAIAVAVLAVKQPDASRWISEAVQAEFAAPDLAPDGAPAQLARPAGEVRTVKAE